MLSITSAVIDQTLQHFRAGGENKHETVVLWLGRRHDAEQIVEAVYRPAQIADRDFFRILPTTMRELLIHLRIKKLQILAQCHSHPELAFHSEADNRWAIVRHVGALSLVIPWFGLQTTVSSFFDDVAVFQLDGDDRWCGAPPRSTLRIHPDAST